MKAWKWIGLASIAGVAAGGVAVARQERVRRAYTPDEVRSRLHARLAEADVSAGSGDGPLGARTPPRDTGRREEAAMAALTNGSDHLPDVHHDAELEWAEESKPAPQPDHGPSTAPLMDLE